jgi:predicted permease
MSSLVADLRYAWRSLTRAPLFSAVVIASIALGTGANTAVFTLLDQVALRRLPVERPSELVQISPAPDAEGYGGNFGDGSELSWPMYRDLGDHQQVFTAMFARFVTPLHVGYRDQSERSVGELVSGSYFPTLGVGPALGRVFTPEDDRVPGGHPVAVLGYEYWQERFAGDREVVGRTILVNGHPLTVIGVAAAGFHGIDLGRPAQLFVPLAMKPQTGPLWLDMNDRRFAWLQVFARLRPGVSREQSRAGLQPYYTSVLERESREPAFAKAPAQTRARFVASKVSVDDASRGRSELRSSVTRPLQVLMGAAAGVLLIACANLANLLLVRGASRRRELALRLALGAGRARVIWLLLVEALLLAALGGLAGVFIATWGAGLLLGYFLTPESPIAVAASLDGRTLGFMALVAIATAVLAGVAPARRSTRLDLASSLKAAGDAVVREQPHLRKTLVIVQVALSFLMLAGAGVFLRSLDNLRRIDAGIVVDRVVTFSVDLEQSGYGSARSLQFARDLLARARSTPGVSAVGFSTLGVLEGSYWGNGVTVEGFAPPPGEYASTLINAVSPRLFSTLGVPVVMGRDFDTIDEQRRRPPGERGEPWRTAIVNETFVRRYFGGRNPVGRHIGMGGDPGIPMPIEVVGVVRDAKYGGLREDARAQVFFPAFQAGGINNLTLYVRSDAPTTAVVDNVRRLVASLDPAIPIFGVATLEDKAARTITNERLIAALSSGFGILATLLAVVGLYGVMAYTVTRRTREIGIRLALGAVASRVAGGVIREAGMLVAAGLAIALPIAWQLGRFVESLLYGVPPFDAVTVTLAAVSLTLVSMLAALAPARRAARIDPIRALRQD